MVDHNALSRTRRVRTRFSRVLLIWSIVSLVTAVAVLTVGSWQQRGAAQSLLGAVGIQFLIWGGIDAIFAWIGLSDAGLRAQSDAEKLIRTLRFSVRLNYGLLIIGIFLLGGGTVLRTAALIGHGIGVLAQVTFLILFDSLLLRAMLRANG